MHSLQSILEGIRQGDYLTSIVLTEAYLHISICPDHCCFLRFCYNNCHYQYKALPFGLSSAPRAFTKVLVALTAHLRTVPIRIMSYLDGILILSRSRDRAVVDLDTTVHALQSHGFSINKAKSHLVPTTHILHLEAWFDTEATQVFLSEERQDSLRQLISQVDKGSKVSLATLSRLLGKMVSAITIVPWVRLHTRELQWLLLPFQKVQRSTSLVRIILHSEVRHSLHWWASPAISRGCHFRLEDRITITTDASLTGWGAHLDTHVAQGKWSEEESALSINLLRTFRHCPWRSPGEFHQTRRPPARGRWSTRTLSGSTNHLALEREGLRLDRFSARVIDTIQASRRPSTDHIYNATWRVFCEWCSNRITSVSASVPQVLEFLQDGLEKGLSPNTLRRQVAALSTMLSWGGGQLLSQHPAVRRFLKGASNLRPPIRTQISHMGLVYGPHLPHERPV
ncbi:uncharacterized protein LOC116506048 [Thamnophis elegans]|uniref:uncharacterized protein LOC116506048 n=1 Tax=Thamnophis elegans TaxID=35005 RepID=UPI00137730C4|nr:uncharacterized protein LOC116506048 [Thamnophis elegans]